MDCIVRIPKEQETYSSFCGQPGQRHPLLPTQALNPLSRTSTSRSSWGAWTSTRSSGGTSQGNLASGGAAGPPPVASTAGFAEPPGGRAWASRDGSASSGPGRLSGEDHQVRRHPRSCTRASNVSVQGIIIYRAAYFGISRHHGELPAGEATLGGTGEGPGLLLPGAGASPGGRAEAPSAADS